MAKQRRNYTVSSDMLERIELIKTYHMQPKTSSGVLEFAVEYYLNHLKRNKITTKNQ